MRGIGLGMLGAAVFAVAAQGQVLIAGSIDGQHPVSPDTVKKIEGTLVMPDGAAKVADYVRYYAPSELAGRKLIAGVYVLKTKLGEARGADGAKALDGVDGAFVTTYGKLPRMSGGGCDMVTTYYDIGLQRFFPMQELGRDARDSRCNAAR